MTKRFFLVSAALLTVFLYSCSSQDIYDSDYTSTYKEALSLWTKHSKIYSKSNSETLIFDITYKSAEFRKSFVEEYSRLYGLESSKDSGKISYSETTPNNGNLNKSMEFFLSAYMADPKLNDFHKKDSIWNIYLETDSGKKIEPSKVVAADRDDARTVKFYPYIGPWSKVYVISFPISEANLRSESVRLFILGVKGRVEFEWEIEGDPTDNL